MLLVEAEFENGPFAAREARHTIASLEDALPAPIRDEVILLVSEIVTNAYRHSGQSASEGIGLRVELTGGTVRIEVSDRGGVRTPAIREADENGGWGLRIVDKVAKRWGTKRDLAGTVVWFEMEAVT